MLPTFNVEAAGAHWIKSQSNTRKQQTQARDAMHKPIYALALWAAQLHSRRYVLQIHVPVIMEDSCGSSVEARHRYRLCRRPVTAQRMMRRGCAAVPHAFPRQCIDVEVDEHKYFAGLKVLQHAVRAGAALVMRSVR